MAIIANRGGRAPICLVCEHASAAIPRSLGELGLSAENRYSHAVWDPGAEPLARTLSKRLDARLVLGGLSRLVYDCNRPPERADAITPRSETIEVPGNQGLSDEARQARIREVHDVFHAALDTEIDDFPTPPALVTIHSFTPIWHGARRETEIGLLHDADPWLAEAMHKAGAGGFRIELNKPYSAADGVTHMLARHAIPRGLPNVMIEVRNDLIADAGGVARAADAIEAMLLAALPAEGRAA